MRSLLVMLVLAYTLAACSSSDSSDGESLIVQDVDVASWKADLLKLDGVGPTVDMARLEDLTISDCTTSVDDLALRFTLEGSNPDVTRLNMTYVCPRLVDKVDQAMAQGRDTTS